MRSMLLWGPGVKGINWVRGPVDHAAPSHVRWHSVSIPVLGPRQDAEVTGWCVTRPRVLPGLAEGGRHHFHVTSTYAAGRSAGWQGCHWTDLGRRADVATAERLPSTQRFSNPG